MTVGPARNGEWLFPGAVRPTPCPICKASSPCVDYNSVDNGVGTQIFEEQYECWLHGVFGFDREGEPCWMHGEPEKLTVEEKLAELDRAIGWEPKVNPG